MDISQFKHIHCIGIGGVGLSAIAEIFLQRGIAVSGSDMKEGENSLRLASHGAAIYYGHKAENIAGADLLIYSNAVSGENPELLAAKSAGIPCITRAQALGALMAQWPESIAISGTHGKTTTTSMISLVLDHCDQDPTILVGGTLPQFGGNVRIGRGPCFVTEACEYMDSFLQLAPTTGIILNIDEDHLDYFKDLDHIVQSFDRFAHLLPKDGTLIAYNANPCVSTVIQNADCRVIRFGYTPDCDYWATDIAFSGYPSFQICHRGKPLGRLQLSVPGHHNITNALAAFACCHNMGMPADAIIETLSQFRGAQRRFDVKGTTKDGLQIVDDYAHHPTEIKATLQAAQDLPHGDLWCLFQPHTYTRTLALFNDFAEALAQADHLVLAEIFAAREAKVYNVSSADLADTIKEQHPDKDVRFLDSFEAIADHVRAHAKPGDLVLTMGAGDIYKVGEMLLADEER